MTTPTAAWPAPSLVTSLSRAGWGDLAGREWQGVRTTLRAVVDVLPHRSAEGLTTASQIADSAGLSPRWVRRCLHALEDLGVIVWRRGGIVDGKPQPSWIRIVKATLVELVMAARPIGDAINAARRIVTASRIADLGRLYLRSKGRQERSPSSAHAALSTSPRPLAGEPPSSPPVERTPGALSRAEWLAQEGLTSWREAIQRFGTDHNRQTGLGSDRVVPLEACGS